MLPGLLAVQLCRGAVRYQIATFDVPGYVGSTALNGVNNLGDMVGLVAPDSPQGFIQLHTGQLTLFAFPGAFEIVPTGINDVGVVVGWVKLQKNQTYAYRINDSGAVAGSYYLDSTNRYTNYVRASSGTVIATFDVGKCGGISGINNGFVVVGTFGQGGVEH